VDEAVVMRTETQETLNDLLLGEEEADPMLHPNQQLSSGKKPPSKKQANQKVGIYYHDQERRLGA